MCWKATSIFDIVLLSIFSTLSNLLTRNAVVDINVITTHIAVPIVVLICIYFISLTFGTLTFTSSIFISLGLKGFVDTAMLIPCPFACIRLA